MPVVLAPVAALVTTTRAPLRAMSRPVALPTNGDNDSGDAETGATTAGDSTGGDANSGDSTAGTNTSGDATGGILESGCSCAQVTTGSV